MKIIFYAIGESISEIIQVGSIELVQGELKYTGKAKDITEGLPMVVEPGNPSHVLRPADGEAYLRALPYEFRSPYLRAVLK